MKRFKILVADDIREIRDMLRLFLEQDYDVVLARNGEEAWELFNSEKPDLVLSDCVMPRINGMELRRRIKLQSFSPETPVIMITAATRESDVPDGLWGDIAGMDGFISKPFGREQVLGKVVACLSKLDNTALGSKNNEPATTTVL
ncbi:MAG: response regulator [Candidatus Sumerlaeaceae bacterium]|nr:response regulator [Candidatus Sumerlaeaceae bacterium]